MSGKIRFQLAGAAVLMLVILIATTRIPQPPSAPVCSTAWFTALETQYIAVDDGEGHGPDYGDQEWFSGFEHRLNLPDTYGQTKEARCRAIQSNLEARTVLFNRFFGFVRL